MRGAWKRLSWPLHVPAAPTPLLHDDKLYDAQKDFAPITLTSTSPNVLVVNPSLPVKSPQELIAYAKAKPGELNYGGGAAGSSTYLSSELFRSMAGLNMVRIPYKGTGPALNALVAGAIQLMFSTSSAAAPHLKSGRLRALAVTSAQPSPLAPGLPTIAASGVPGYESAAKDGVFAPAHTPAAVVTRLNRAIVQAVKSDEIRTRFLNAGVEVVGSTPEQLAAAVKTDIATIGKLIKDARLRAD